MTPLRPRQTGWERGAAILIRWLVGGVFAIAGMAKLRNPAAFGDAMAGFRLLPEFMLYDAGLFLIWLETTCGLLLLAGIWTRPAATLAAGMSAMFLAALLSALARGLDIQCGCFGALSEGPIGWRMAARALILILLSLCVFLLEGRRSAEKTP